MRSPRVPVVGLAVAAGIGLAAGGVLVIWRGWSRKGRLQRLRERVDTAFRSIAALPGWSCADACVLLSGGLDSAIVAEVGAQVLGLRTAFTVVCTEDATDLPFAVASSIAAGLQHVVLRIPLQELLRRQLPLVVRATQSFDPMSVRNDLAIAHALSEAAARGFRCAATGDGADELLGGYSFTHRLPPGRWAYSRNRMAQEMTFGSTGIGQQLGMCVASPFTQAGVVKACLALSKDDCVRELPDGSLQGKVPLRELFPRVTSAGRRKDPIEVGCGTTALSRPGFFDELVDDSTFAVEAAFVLEQHGVEIRDKEHLVYYRAFREVFPNGLVPGKPRHGSDPCPKCGYELSSKTQIFCVTCGHYDPQMRAHKRK
ncbi:hypothetical protein HYH03_004137 [Edaphochlamys debaryana]|uniref:Asparagine synthetase domain-containing protein n=1 Tax=Edaphochlamys debaryana TaxID=47281 RepID=A0A835YBP2_9CHLO|nr:hypothetical protein HYH03_004137 [Edaphochlamys debaryana]|eukprot:KAG2497871.1 hypothetical protein HYH03_004137 [Edaphochlamys debaryana]